MSLEFYAFAVAAEKVPPSLHGTSAAMSLTRLPSLCIARVASSLGSPGRTEEVAAASAAALASTCRAPAVRELTEVLWEAVDPGCAEEARLARERRNGWMMSVADSALPSTTPANASLAELRNLCRAAGASLSGTKEQLRRALASRIETAAEDAKRFLAACDPFFGHGAVWPECPVRPRMRQLVRALLFNRGEMVTATMCKQEFGLSEELLRKIACTYKRNPCYRSAAPMRLYPLPRVLRARLQLRGEASLDPQKKADAEMRSAKRAMAAEASRQLRQTALSTELAAHGLDSEPVVHRATLDKFLTGTGATLQEASRVLSRHQQLGAALAAVGLPPQPRADSELCAEFINSGFGDVSSIAHTMARMNFLHRHTEYVQLADDAFERERERSSGWGHKEYVRFSKDECREIRHSAEPEALARWVQKVGGIALALERPELPLALHPDILNAFRAKSSKRRRRG
jgi:hypothetical protein